MTTCRKTGATPEELLALAAKTGDRRVVGRHREEDGVVPGWHSWAAQHSQKDDDITICRGRDEWKERSLSKNDNEVSLVSWNILSDTWLSQYTLGERAYEYTTPETGDWTFRLQLLLQWMDDLNPDILAVQELDYDKFETDLFPALQRRGYDGLMQKPKKKAAEQPCGNATFWKSDKYQMTQNASFSRTLCIVLEAVHNTESPATTTSSSSVCVINVHLESSQAEVGVDRRARQMNSALSYAATEAPPNAAVLVCGDNNTGADSELHRVLREYHWHGHDFSSVYEHPGTHSTLPVSVATFMIPGHHYVIDHIFYAQESFRLKCALDAFSPQEREEHIHSRCGFPTAFLPSDHIPIGAILEILPPQTTATATKSQTTEAPTPLSSQREQELTEQWEALQSQRPPHTKGKPSPEELAARKEYASSVKAWKESVKDNAPEMEFVTKLIKNKK